MNTIEVLNTIFRQVFDDDTIMVRHDMTANDVDNWDSLTNINLIIAIECKFEIRFDAKEISAFKKVGDLIDAIERKMATK